MVECGFELIVRLSAVIGSTVTRLGTYLAELWAIHNSGSCAIDALRDGHVLWVSGSSTASQD